MLVYGSKPSSGCRWGRDCRTGFALRLVQVPEGGSIPPAPRPRLPSCSISGTIDAFVPPRNVLDLILAPHAGSVSVAFQLTAAWANPPGGIIPSPSAADQSLV